MQLKTLRFGEIEIDENKLVAFPAGIPGFEGSQTFAMLTPDEEMPFSFLQSTDDGDLSFIVANPFFYFPDYDFELHESVRNELNISSEEEVMVACMLSISDKDEFTLNLLAPIVVNSKERLGKQVILHNSKYKTKHQINFNQVNGQGEAEDSVVGEDSPC